MPQSTTSPPLVSIGAVALAVIGLIYVNGLRAQVDELEQTQRESQEISEMIRSAFADLEQATEQVESEANRFDYENWQDVVPDVRSAADELAGAMRQMERRLSMLD